MSFAHPQILSLYLSIVRTWDLFMYQDTLCRNRMSLLPSWQKMVLIPPTFLVGTSPLQEQSLFCCLTCWVFEFLLFFFLSFFWRCNTKKNTLWSKFMCQIKYYKDLRSIYDIIYLIIIEIILVSHARFWIPI